MDADYNKHVGVGADSAHDDGIYDGDYEGASVDDNDILDVDDDADDAEDEGDDHVDDVDDKRNVDVDADAGENN